MSLHHFRVVYYTFNENQISELEVGLNFQKLLEGKICISQFLIVLRLLMSNLGSIQTFLEHNGKFHQSQLQNISIEID